MFIFSFSYTDEEKKTKVDFETQCFRLLIMILISPLRRCMVCTVYSVLLISYFFTAFAFPWLIQCTPHTSRACKINIFSGAHCTTEGN